MTEVPAGADVGVFRTTTPFSGMTGVLVAARAADRLAPLMASSTASSTAWIPVLGVEIGGGGGGVSVADVGVSGQDRDLCTMAGDVDAADGVGLVIDDKAVRP